MNKTEEKYNDEWKKELNECLITYLCNRKNTADHIVEKIGYYYMDYAPAYLYVYYKDNNRDLETVRANKMWFSAPCKFNDVFDCDIKIDEEQVFQSTLRLNPSNMEIREGSSGWLHIKDVVAKEIGPLRDVFETMKTSMGISCFSELDNSLLMWSHYANNHRGMCVEYNLLDINKRLGFSPVPVMYSDEKVNFNSINPDTIDSDTFNVFYRGITTKSYEWAYEREWRIIRDDGACGDNWDSEKKGALLNMICPKSIILGCMAQTDFERKVREYCEEKKINLYKMVKSEKLYKLEKTPILQFENRK